MDESVPALQYIVLVGGAVAVLGTWLGWLVRRILRWLDAHIASCMREIRVLIDEDRRKADDRWRRNSSDHAIVRERLDTIDGRLDRIETRIDTHIHRSEGDGR